MTDKNVMHVSAIEAEIDTENCEIKLKDHATGTILASVRFNPHLLPGAAAALMTQLGIELQRIANEREAEKQDPIQV